MFNDLPSDGWGESQDGRIGECLAKILASQVFTHSARSQRFLSYVVTETLAGRGDKLKGYNIGLEVFDRDASFDPTVDAIVRVEAARLRGKLREYYDGEGREDCLRFDLPKGKYAVAIEWQEDASHQAGKTEHPQVIHDKPSLAILPFANMSSDAEQEYFVDGFTDCLITEVSRLPGLFVISRQSAFVYKKIVRRAEDIARELGVRYLLEGSVQRAGEWVRITAQLIDAGSGAHVWAQHYDRQLKDIFAIQDEVTQCIASVLQVKLAADAPEANYGGTSSMAAHDALLRGLEGLWTYEPQPVEEAQSHFERAVALDPQYAAAHVWLARALTMRWIFFWDKREGILERALQHVRIALDINPELPLAHAVMCWVQRWRGQKDAAIAAGRRAVLLDPNSADAHLFLALALTVADCAQEGLQVIEKGMRLNPHPSTLYQFTFGLCHLVLGNQEQAAQAFRRGIALKEPFIPNHVFLCLVYTLQHKEEEARCEREKALALSGNLRPVLQLGWLSEPLAQRFEQLYRQVDLL